MDGARFPGLQAAIGGRVGLPLVRGGDRGAWGLLATAAPVGWWAWIARTLPADAEAGGGLMVAVIQLCIAFGSTLGGALFDGPGYQATFITSAGILLAAAILAILVRRLANSPAGC